MNRIHLLITLVAATTMLAPAQAQTNSLRKQAAQRPTRAPIGQAQPARELILPVAAPAARQIVPGVNPPPANPQLLKNSLIAIEPPKPKNIQVHDLITIVIREDKTSVSDARLKSEKTWEMEARLREWFRITNSKLATQTFPDGQPGIDFSFDNSYEGKGRNNRNDSLTTRITAEVIDIKPNGVLTLQARKMIELDEDVQIITLTGICRTVDVNAQNTVLSTQLADANISVHHTGPARDAARRGWLMRAFDVLRPF